MFFQKKNKARRDRLTDKKLQPFQLPTLELSYIPPYPPTNGQVKSSRQVYTQILRLVGLKTMKDTLNFCMILITGLEALENISYTIQRFFPGYLNFLGLLFRFVLIIVCDYIFSPTTT